MGSFDDVQPLPRFQLIGADYCPDLIVQNLRSGAGKGTETGILKLLEERCNGNLQRGRTLPYLQRREGMDVKPGCDIS